MIFPNKNRPTQRGILKPRIFPWFSRVSEAKFEVSHHGVLSHDRTHKRIDITIINTNTNIH